MKSANIRISEGKIKKTKTILFLKIFKIFLFFIFAFLRLFL